MRIITKIRDPKSTDFKKNEIVINTKEGALFFKSELGVHRLISEVQTPQMIDYGPHPDYTGIYSEVGHTHAAPTITNYFYHHFANDWSSATTEKLINFTGTVENTTVQEDRIFLMPFAGKICELYWKQTGLCDNITVKVYVNINDDGSSISGAVNNTPAFTQVVTQVNIGTGDGGEFGSMNTLPINLNFNAGDHIAISLQAASDGIDEMTGQILFTNNISL